MASENDKPDEEEFISLEGLDEATQPEANKSAVTENDDDDDEDKESAFDHYQASKDEVDQYFAETDGEFLKSLKDLKKIQSDNVIESADLDPELLHEEEVSVVQLYLQKFRLIFVPYFFVVGFLTNGISKIKASIGFLKENIEKLKGEGRKEVIDKFKTWATETMQPVVSAFLFVKRLSIKAKAFFLTTVLLIALLVTFFNQIIKGQFLPDPTRQDINSFDSVASIVYPLEKKFRTEPFDSALRFPEYVVQLRLMVVNLKKTLRHNKNPMVSFEMFLEATNQEAAVEIRDREIEFLDRIQRTVEAMTYRELQSQPGKERMKTAIRRDLNFIATKGRVKRVYIKSMNLMQ